jgi:hypothetical protein
VAPPMRKDRSLYDERAGERIGLTRNMTGQPAQPCAAMCSCGIARMGCARKSYPDHCGVAGRCGLLSHRTRVS